MENQSVRIVTLPAMKVAAFYAFSSSPELEARQKMEDWAKSHNIAMESPKNRVFGFNNPDPTSGSPNYGYEVWLTFDNDIQPRAGDRIKQFPGGLYAVIRCDVNGDPGEIIPTKWGELVKWFEASHYKHGNHQWLEEHLTHLQSTDFVLDLYLPITE
jgi:AraC family transcriptional regulator